MKKEIAEAWVQDLRTDPPQCRGMLSDGDGHCCLGRLVVVLGKRCGDSIYLEPWHMDLAGMKSNCGAFVDDILGPSSLAHLNDTRKTFAQIADVIEERWEEL